MLFVWFLLYGGIYTAAESLSQMLGTAHVVTVPAMLLYTGGFVLRLCRTGRAHTAGIKTIPLKDLKKYLFFLPLGALPVYNVLTGSGWELSFSLAALMLCASIAEELFFRGFLLRILLKWSRAGGIVVSGAVFALAHFVNLIQGADLSYVLMQTLCAFSAGIGFAAVTAASGSVLPCIAAHFLINISAGSGTMGPAECGLGLWVCAAVYVVYGIWIYIRNNKCEVN